MERSAAVREAMYKDYRPGRAAGIYCGEIFTPSGNVLGFLEHKGTEDTNSTISMHCNEVRSYTVLQAAPTPTSLIPDPVSDVLTVLMSVVSIPSANVK
ncbi:hypothetical protein QTP86_017243 [Hemibagrus guttatus]|nr:hypothetical protein QTP86_017243 [Hemibagrus guttatus]